MIAAFIGQATGIFLEFLFMIFSAKIYGAYIYGQFTFAYTIISIVVVFTKCGFENSILYYCARNDIGTANKRCIVHNSILISTILCLFVICLFFTGNDFFITLCGDSGLELKYFRYMLPIIFLETINALLLAVIRGLKKIGSYYLGYTIIPYAIRLVLVFLFRLFRIDSFLAIIIAYILGCFLSIIFCVISLVDTRLLFGSRSEFSFSDLLKMSVPVLMAGAVSVINNKVDQYMVGFWCGSNKVAVYSMAMNIGKVSSFALVAINSFFAPYISDYYSSGQKEKLKDMYSRTTRWAILFSALILGFVSIFSFDIMEVIGEEYVYGSVVLIIVAAGELFNSMVGSVGYLNTMTGKANYMFVASFSSVLLNIYANYRLIPQYGIFGAAIASAGAVVLCNLLNFIFMYYNLRIQPYTKKTINIVIVVFCAVAAMVGLRNVFGHDSIDMLITYGIVYVLISIVGTLWCVCDSKERVLFLRYVCRIKNFIIKSNIFRKC